MKRKTSSATGPMLLIFITMNALFVTGRNWLAKMGINQEVVILGNLLLFAVTFASFFITKRSFASQNPNAFLRAMYGGFIIKFFVIAIAAFIYIMATKKNVNKPGLFTCMGLYVLYTSLEVAALMKLLRAKKNG
jgi:hypothetical protein